MRNKSGNRGGYGFTGVAVFQNNVHSTSTKLPILSLSHPTCRRIKDWTTSEAVLRSKPLVGCQHDSNLLNHYDSEDVKSNFNVSPVRAGVANINPKLEY